MRIKTEGEIRDFFKIVRFVFDFNFWLILNLLPAFYFSKNGKVFCCYFAVTLEVGKAEGESDVENNRGLLTYPAGGVGHRGEEGGGDVNLLGKKKKIKKKN